MGTLFHRFSADEQERYLTQTLAPGRILYLFCHFTKEPKDKFLVLLCCRPRPYLFFINSHIDAFLRNQRDLLRCQIELLPSDYPCFRHSCYLDCHEVIRNFTENEIRHQLQGDLARVKGEFTSATRKKVIEAVIDATTISPIDKERIIEALDTP